MTDAEALMWRLERSDARYRAVITVVLSLERSPGLPRLRRRVDVVARTFARLRQRVSEAPVPLVVPRWEPDAHFDLDSHVMAAPAPGDGGFEDVLALAATLGAAALDHSRPLWQMILVEGMAGGRAAVVLRLHHSLTDGLGALKLAAVLFDLHADGADPGPFPPDGAGSAGDRPTDDRPTDDRITDDRLTDDLRHEVGVASRLLRWAGPALTRLASDAVTDPERRAGEAVDLGRSLLRVVTPSTRPGSPLMTGRSGRAVFGAVTLDLDEVRGVARAAGATVNDVFLSAALDGLRRYHAAQGSHPEHLRMGIPLDLRSGGDDDLHNQFFPARLLAPLQIVDPMDRLRAVHQLVLDERAQPAVRAYEAMAAVAARAPGAEAAMARVLSSVDVMASNVVGSPDALHLAGVPVLRMVPFGPRTGSALNLTTVSYDGALHIGINMDPVAITDTAGLAGCLADAFAGSVIYA